MGNDSYLNEGEREEFATGRGEETPEQRYIARIAKRLGLSVDKFQQVCAAASQDVQELDPESMNATEVSQAYADGTITTEEYLATKRGQSVLRRG